MIINQQIGILGNPERTSNLGLTGCYNVCGITHPFNEGKREECQRRCDKQFSTAPSEEQQALLEEMLNQQTSGGLSTGAVLGIIGGILVLTIAGVIIIKKLKK